GDRFYHFKCNKCQPYQSFKTFSKYKTKKYKMRLSIYNMFLSTNQHYFSENKIKNFANEKFSTKKLNFDNQNFDKKFFSAKFEDKIKFTINYFHLKKVRKGLKINICYLLPNDYNKRMLRKSKRPQMKLATLVRNICSRNSKLLKYDLSNLNSFCLSNFTETEKSILVSLLPNVDNETKKLETVFKNPFFQRDLRLFRDLLQKGDLDQDLRLYRTTTLRKRSDKSSKIFWTDKIVDEIFFN
ncbi:hypothetical protein MHBO_003203, partial [Bonamia ostreae]